MLQIKNHGEPLMKFILQNWALLLMHHEPSLQQNKALKKVLKKLFVLKTGGSEAEYNNLLQKTGTLRQLIENILES